jgi:hypothetical protein
MIESTAITRELGARLRECRERAGLRTVDTARNLGWPSSKVSKLESGERKCDPMDLARYLGTCDVPHDEAWSIIRLFHLPETGIWPRPHGDQLPDVLLTLIMNETAASTICEFHPLVVPGLVQTRAYAAAVIRGNISVRPESVEGLVEARMNRQELLKRRDSANTMFFISESVLRHPVCKPAEMSEQLLHLVLLHANPRVKIRIVPTSAGVHAGMNGPFIFMGFTDRQPVVFLESEVMSTLVEKREMIETYRMIRTELDRTALDTEESRSLLADLASKYDRAAEERNRDGGMDCLAQEQL